MEELLRNLEQIKENILNKKKENNKVQSNYIQNNNILNIDNNRNKRSSNNYQRLLILSRPSIVNICKDIKSIDMSNKFYLIEESSDNEDGFNEDTKHIVPSLRKVAKNIFDPNVIMVLNDLKYFPKESQPGLIISGIEEWVTEKHLKYFLKRVPSFIDKCKLEKNLSNNNRKNETSELDIHSIKFFVEQNKRYAYVKLKNYNQMEIIGNYFLNPIKKLYPSYNSKKEKIEVYFAYDLLKLTKNHWYGVILRNLPPNCNDKSIYNFTEQKVKNGIKYCLNPIVIDNMFCALVVCKELEFAEKLCHDLNNTEINNKYIKANLHPQICKIRNEYLSKNYENFSKEGYLFNINAEQSEKCLPFAKPFMEFFFPDYLNSFNSNNKSKKKEKEIKSNVDNNENSKKNKETEKNLREKDLILASSIFNLFNQKSKNFEESKINNNQNMNEKLLINNNSKQNNSNDKTNENQNKFINENDIKNTIQQGQKPQINQNFIKKEDKINENKNLIEENKEKDLKQTNNNINNEAKESNNINYTQEEINYYSYNMEDQKFYENLEIQEQRKTSSQIRRNNYYKDDFKSYNKSNYYNKGYKSQRYERKDNNSSPYRQYNTSYKKHNRDYYISSFDKEHNDNKNRERSKEKYNNKNDNDEWKNFRDNNDKSHSNKRNDREKGRDYEKERYERRDRDIDRDWKKNRERSRDKEWEKERERNRERYKERDRDREKFFDDRNKRYSDNRYYERNNNYNYNERRKESWHSNSKPNYEREKKDIYYKNKNYN